jgi:hypothetical protein
MSLAEIKDAITDLTAKELAELAAFIQTQDSHEWDREIEKDFSPEGRHHEVLAGLDAAIDAGEATPLPTGKRHDP